MVGPALHIGWPFSRNNPTALDQPIRSMSSTSVLGIADELTGDRYDRTLWEEHRRVLAEAFATRTRDEWSDILAGTEAWWRNVLDE